MKKLLFALCLFASINGSAQNIDSVANISSLTLQAQDWAWLIGSYNFPVDSTGQATLRKLRDAVRTANVASYTTNITISNLPASVVMKFYYIAKSAPAGQIVARYTAITGAIQAKTSLTSFINAYNEAIESDFERARDRGKYILMDN